MIRTAVPLFWAVSSVCILGCLDSTGLSHGDLERIGGGVSFGIIETYRFHESGVGEPELALFLETEESYGCVNYSLDLDLEMDEGDVSVTLFGVNEPEMCLTAIGPAFSYLPLPVSEGDLTLHFHFAGQRDFFQASISEVSIATSPRNGQFTRRQEALLWRYPPRSFALVCDAERWGEEVCTELKASLQTAMDLSEVSFSGEGRNPYPTDSEEAGRDWRASYFRLGGEADFSDVRQAFCSFVSARYDLPAYLLSWRNERVRSWVPDHCP